MAFESEAHRMLDTGALLNWLGGRDGFVEVYDELRLPPRLPLLQDDPIYYSGEPWEGERFPILLVVDRSVVGNVARAAANRISPKKFRRSETGRSLSPYPDISHAAIVHFGLGGVKRAVMREIERAASLAVSADWPSPNHLSMAVNPAVGFMLRADRESLAALHRWIMAGDLAHREEVPVWLYSQVSRRLFPMELERGLVKKLPRGSNADIAGLKEAAATELLTARTLVARAWGDPVAQEPILKALNQDDEEERRYFLAPDLIGRQGQAIWPTPSGSARRDTIAMEEVVAALVRRAFYPLSKEVGMFNGTADDVFSRLLPPDIRAQHLELWAKLGPGLQESIQRVKEQTLLEKPGAVGRLLGLCR